jgi:hypothetical protein
MGKIAADANPLAKPIERGTIGASFLINRIEDGYGRSRKSLEPVASLGLSCQKSAKRNP